jgi:hypothetical protein
MLLTLLTVDTTPIGAIKNKGCVFYFGRLKLTQRRQGQNGQSVGIVNGVVNFHRLGVLARKAIRSPRGLAWGSGAGSDNMDFYCGVTAADVVNIYSMKFAASYVPEPVTMMLLGVGTLMARRRR